MKSMAFLTLFLFVLVCYGQEEKTYECNDEGCKTCYDDDCQVSCTGPDCGDCPNGKCCTESDCNICRDGKCCDNKSCTIRAIKCINKCKRNNVDCEIYCIEIADSNDDDNDDVPTRDVLDLDWNAPAPCTANGGCRDSNCISGNCQQNRCSGYSCVETSCSGNNCNRCPSGRCCDGSECNICHGSSCCRTESCNSCFRQCRSTCTRSRCYGSCYSNCLETQTSCQDEGDCNEHQDNNIIIQQKQPTMRKAYNVTTLINITNLINNTNEIESPILVNNTNLNNLDVNYTIPNGQGSISGNLQQSNCCFVVHPPQCHRTPEGVKCYRRKHRECSSICTSGNIQVNPNHPPLPPHCHYIKHYPYIQCGQHNQHNCDACFNCHGLSVQQCINGPQCPAHCRQALQYPVQPPILPQVQPPPQLEPLPQVQSVPQIQPLPQVQPLPQIQPLPQVQPFPQIQPLPQIQPAPQIQPIPEVQAVSQVQPLAIQQSVPINAAPVFAQTYPVFQTNQSPNYQINPLIYQSLPASTQPITYPVTYLQQGMQTPSLQIPNQQLIYTGQPSLQTLPAQSNGQVLVLGSAGLQSNPLQIGFPTNTLQLNPQNQVLQVVGPATQPQNNNQENGVPPPPEKLVEQHSLPNNENQEPSGGDSSNQASKNGIPNGSIATDGNARGSLPLNQQYQIIPVQFGPAQQFPVSQWQYPGSNQIFFPQGFGQNGGLRLAKETKSEEEEKNVE